MSFCILFVGSARQVADTIDLLRFNSPSRVLRMGAGSISSLRTFYIRRDRRFVTIPANIKQILLQTVF